jgi:hypothetical protein
MDVVDFVLSGRPEVSEAAMAISRWARAELHRKGALARWIEVLKTIPSGGRPEAKRLSRALQIIPLSDSSIDD